MSSVTNIPQPNYFFSGVYISTIDVNNLPSGFQFKMNRLLFCDDYPVIDCENNTYIIVRYDDRATVEVKLLSFIINQCKYVENQLLKLCNIKMINAGLCQITKEKSHNINWHGHQLVYCHQCCAYDLYKCNELNKGWITEKWFTANNIK